MPLREDNNHRYTLENGVLIGIGIACILWGFWFLYDGNMSWLFALLIGGCSLLVGIEREFLGEENSTSEEGEA